MTYAKAKPIYVNKNFYSDIFDCKCNYFDCTITIVDPTLAIAIEKLWDISGEFKINSGYRCKKHNADVGGFEKSTHLIGKAVDIESLQGLSGPELSKYVLQIPELEHGGLGVAPHWLHCDVRSTRARWTYPLLH